MDSRDRFYGFSLLFNIFAEKKTYYAGIMLDAPSIVLCSKLCRHNVSDPSLFWSSQKSLISCCAVAFLCLIFTVLVHVHVNLFLNITCIYSVAIGCTAHMVDSPHILYLSSHYWEIFGKLVRMTWRDSSSELQLVEGQAPKLVFFGTIVCVVYTCLLDWTQVCMLLIFSDGTILQNWLCNKSHKSRKILKFIQNRTIQGKRNYHFTLNSSTI